MVMLRISLISDHHHHHHCHWSLSCLTYESDKYNVTLNDAISLVFAFVLLSLSLLLVLSMSDQPIPEAVFEIQGTDVCERSLVDYLDGLSQGKKNTIWPFFSCSTCYDFKLFFLLHKPLQGPSYIPFYVMGHVAAARKRNHQWSVSLTPNNTWVTYIG